VTTANTFKVTTVNATGSVTFNATAGGTAGQVIFIEIVNDATSGKTITFGTNFHTSATVIGVTSKTSTIAFMSDGSAWFELCRTVGMT
jgi:hypothetical protein